MYKKKTISIILLLLLFITQTSMLTSAQPINDDPPQTLESPKELTPKEFQKDIDELYSRHPDFKIIIDLEDPKGIDPNLLPQDIANLVDGNTKIVAYKETRRAGNNVKASGLSSLYNKFCLSIGCASPSGSRDLTVADWYGNVKQYSRVYALRYDHYSGCDYYTNCYGWEIENQWSKWDRTSYSWQVKNARMKTYIYGENYCTEASATLNYASYYFDPSFSNGTSTNWYSISGFPNKAYVPLTDYGAGWSRTRSDIYLYSTLQYNDALTTQYWPRNQ